jgi:hypothetical protein
MLLMLQVTGVVGGNRIFFVPTGVVALEASLVAMLPAGVLLRSIGQSYIDIAIANP